MVPTFPWGLLLTDEMNCGDCGCGCGCGGGGCINEGENESTLLLILKGALDFR